MSPRRGGKASGLVCGASVGDVLRDAGYADAELWVYADNPSAVVLYEKLGWQADGPTRTHPRSGRTERHYALQLIA